jgi:hypothetical protein
LALKGAVAPTRNLNEDGGSFEWAVGGIVTVWQAVRTVLKILFEVFHFQLGLANLFQSCLVKKFMSESFIANKVIRFIICYIRHRLF